MKSGYEFSSDKIIRDIELYKKQRNVRNRSEMSSYRTTQESSLSMTPIAEEVEKVKGKKKKRSRKNGQFSTSIAKAFDLYKTNPNTPRPNIPKQKLRQKSIGKNEQGESSCLNFDLKIDQLKPIEEKVKRN